MGNKGMFVGALGQKLDDNLKAKLDNAVKTAIDTYEIRDFYFCNEQVDGEEDELISTAIAEYKKIGEYIAHKIQDYKKEIDDTEIKTALIAARPDDTNFTAKLYDEIIQGYYIYGQELESPNANDAFILRDNFAAANIDIVFWYSNRILADTSCFLKSVKDKNRIQYV